MTPGPADLPAFAPPRRPGPDAAPDVVAHVRQLMGMPISIHVRGPAARSPRVASAIEAAYDDLAWVEATFSRWRPESELSRLRRGELTVAECSRDMEQVLDLCDDFGVRTGGAFLHVLPDEATGEWLLDPTGLVKGWAIARAADILRRLDGHAHCVNAGGDIAVGGVADGPAGDRPWRLGIEDPDVPGTIARIVELHDGGLATSGCAARGAHLVDPATGERRLRRGSVSVLAPDIISADAWATALFVGPPGLDERIVRRPGWRVIRL